MTRGHASRVDSCTGTEENYVRLIFVAFGFLAAIEPGSLARARCSRYSGALALFPATVRDCSRPFRASSINLGTSVSEASHPMTVCRETSNSCANSSCVRECALRHSRTSSPVKATTVLVFFVDDHVGHLGFRFPAQHRTAEGDAEEAGTSRPTTHKFKNVEFFGHLLQISSSRAFWELGNDAAIAMQGLPKSKRNVRFLNAVGRAIRRDLRYLCAARRACPDCSSSASPDFAASI